MGYVDGVVDKCLCTSGGRRRGGNWPDGLLLDQEGGGWGYKDSPPTYIEPKSSSNETLPQLDASPAAPMEKSLSHPYYV